MASATKDTLRIGIFYESIYDVDLANYSYGTNFWMWSVVQGDVNEDGVIDDKDSLASIDRISLIEISNAKDYTYSHQSTQRSIVNGQTLWWASQFCKASIYQKWSLNNYPFDKQKLVLKFENSSYDTSQAIMLNEQDSLTFKRDINLLGWNIIGSHIHSRTVEYKTDFGDPNGKGTSAYSRVVFAIDIERLEAVKFFIKLCLGVFVAFLVALIVFGIGPSGMDSRFGLGIGALFAVAANKYVVDANIPQNATNCLVDKVHEMTLVYILFILVANIISLRLHEGEKSWTRKRFDKLSFITLLLSYISILAYMLYKAQTTTAM